MSLFRGKQDKPVFIHISKNAGTSIIQSARRGIVVAGHRTAANWCAENGRAAPLFAVIRNPFDRVVSEYFYRKRRYDAGERNPHLANLHKPFEEWVVATYRDGEFRTSAFFKQAGIEFNERNMIGDVLIWFLPQKHWISDRDGTVLVDHLLRYEHLEADWARFSEQHRIKRTLERRNASTRDGNYRRYYSARTREIIANYYHEDLTEFGYRFD